jgi:hypothetical protein
MSFNRIFHLERALHAAAMLPSLAEFYLNGDPLETHPEWECATPAEARIGQQSIHPSIHRFPILRCGA